MDDEKREVIQQPLILAHHADLDVNKRLLSQCEKINIEDIKEISESFIDICPDGIYIACEGVIIYANPIFVKMMGAKKPEDLLGKNSLELIHEDSKSIVIERIQNSLKGIKINPNIEEKYVRLDGKIIFVEVTARAFVHEGKNCGLMIVRDIGIRKLMEEELHRHQVYLEEIIKSKTFRLESVIDQLSNQNNITQQALGKLMESEEKFSSIFKESMEAMLFFSSANGSILDINKSFTRVTGYEKDEALGISIDNIDKLINKKDFKMLMKKILIYGFVRDIEVPFYTKNKEKRLALLVGQILKIDRQDCVFITFRDITDYKELEKDFQRFDQLNLVGEMAAGIAHEIRNPMTTVRGFLQMFGQREEYQGDKQFFDLMIEELDRANSIISEFLSLAKGRLVEFKCQNINTIIETLSPLIWSDAMVFGSTVELELGKVKNLLLDEKEIRQLILNLARNGLEAMPEGGMLTIKTFEKNKEVYLEISDSGKGIRPEVLDKIGKPFFTTKEKGTGLGLAVCYSISARHNAEMKISSSSTGAKITIKFKASQKNKAVT